MQPFRPRFAKDEQVETAGSSRGFNESILERTGIATMHNGRERPMQESQPAQPFQITKVWARNFRSIANTSVELDRLTVLVGPNAAGKSNVLDILRFIKDALRFDLEAAISLRHGPEAIQHRTVEDQTSDVELGLSAREGSGKVRYSLEYGFVLVADDDGSFQVGQEYVRLRPTGWEKTFEIRVEEGRLMQPERLASADNSPHLEPNMVHHDVGTSDLWLLDTSRMWWMRDRKPQPEWDEVSHCLRHFHHRMRETRFYHVSPNTLREPRRVESPYPLAEDAGNLASVLRTMQRRDLFMASGFRDSLSLLIPGVTDLDVDSVGGYLVVRLNHQSGRDGIWIDLAQESDGTIRLLGLLVALYQPRSLSLMGMEEPELTIHPGAMALLADLLNEASRRSQMIVTTHSPDLIDCLTGYRAVERLRIVELVDGVTVVRGVADSQREAVRKHLFSPGELHRMGELESPHE